ncbi:hypothetical protein [Actinosynnema sp. ALI-1.44]|uniref:hypothetical protein n=1 Tax=Actinosynnema sp. ALI-1.44 TaxID=1933779 RepID=UPI00143D800D|nr:hypothetical protein [Actinosynnema sp. ALI-1.44]
MVAVSLTSGAAAAEPKSIGPVPKSGYDGPVPGGFAAWGDLLAMQQKLNRAAEQIAAANGDGFAGIIAAPENRELRVYWKGATEGKVSALVAKLNRTVPVKVLPAAYSLKELSAESARLIKQAGVKSVAPKADGSGLSVGVDRSIRAQTLNSSVPIEQTDAAPAPAASRENDSPPYWGGARWRSPDGGCSTGFAVWHGGTTKMLSAGHCGKNGQTAHDGGGDFMGYIEHDDDPWDTLLINTSSAGRIYDGGVGVNEFSKPVDHAAANWVGNYICVSGSYSGVTCNNVVDEINVTIGIPYTVYGQVRAHQVDHHAAVGNGDSGGPAFDLVPDWSRVIAKGTLTAIDLHAEKPCNGVPTGGNRRCSSVFFFADISKTLPRLGASIVTG